MSDQDAAQFNPGDRVRAKSDVPVEFGSLRGVVVYAFEGVVLIDFGRDGIYTNVASGWELDDTEEKQ